MDVKLDFKWLSLVMSLIVSFGAVVFSLGVLDEISD